MQINHIGKHVANDGLSILEVTAGVALLILTFGSLLLWAISG